VARTHTIIILAAAVVMAAMSVHVYQYYCVDVQWVHAAGIPRGCDPPPDFTLADLPWMLKILWIPFLLMVGAGRLKAWPKWYYAVLIGSVLLFVWGNLMILSDIYKLDIPLVPR
jgi:hypothetical protein